MTYQSLRKINIFVQVFLLSLVMVACGGSSESNDNSLEDTVQPSSSDVEDFAPISLSGISIDQGVFDPAPTVDDNGMVWMSYSYVSTAVSGLTKVETRLATSADGGMSWQDVGVLVNPAVSFALTAPNDVNAVVHEVSRLIYNPFAVNMGAEPWILLWHRYLSVFNGNETLRLFEHGWIAMKTGSTAETLGNERKLFSGAGYDIVNDTDAFGVPEYSLSSLYPAALSVCAALTEPAVMPKSDGLYISMLCAGAAAFSKIILLRCDHNMSNCVYLGDFMQGSEASVLNSSYDGFSAPELVSTDNQDYLMVTPTISTGNIYRGCVAYKITDLANATIERSAADPVAATIIAERGDFNGACAFIEELTASGVLMSEAFFQETPRFRLFATGVQL